MMPFAIHSKNARRIIPTDDEEGYAPYSGPLVCLSLGNRWRDNHVFDKDGVCCYCNTKLEK